MTYYYNMLLTINIQNIDMHNILYNKSTENNIIKNSEFIKILYSSDVYSLNSLIIDTNFKIINIIYKYNKIYFNFDTSKNIDMISKFVELENKLLKLLNNTNLQPIYNLKNYFLLKNNFTVNYKNNTSNVYLKISGIWKNSENYGLIFKFM